MVNFLILIILHIIGDFYLQTTKIARCKNAKKGPNCGECEICKDDAWINWKYLVFHSLFYVLPFGVLFFDVTWTYAIIVMVALLASHILVDSGSCFFKKRVKKTIVFLIDQVLHVGVIWLVLQFVNINFGMDMYYDELKVVFVVLMLIMPCSIIINKIIADIYPDTEETGLFDTGSMIGVMERILTLIFAYFENFPAIAIIITVKTWARTNDLKEPEFRNKYLLGTLTSLVLALLLFVFYKLM